MEYCCHIWTGARSWYLELLDKPTDIKAVGSSLAASREPLTHCENVVNQSLFYWYYFCRYSFELAQLVPLPYSRGRSPGYFDRLHGFLSPSADVTRVSISTVSFLAQLESGILCL